MLFYTHLFFSILIGLFYTDYFHVNNALIFFSLLILFSGFPDIDRSKSKLGKKLGFISSILNWIFGHRKFFHSLTFILPISYMLFFIHDTIAISFLISTLSHLLLDSFTPAGIFPLYPSKIRFSGIIRTGSMLEKIILVIITAIIIIKII